MARRNMVRIVAAIPFVAAMPAAAGDDIGNQTLGLVEAATAGRPVVEVRPRYNRIEEEGYDETTTGWTYRLRLGWRTAAWQGWRATLEGIHTGSADKNFNDDPGQIVSSPYPLLPDPRYTGVNQAHVEYAGDSGARLRIGRQVVRLENQRWVSDNDFRQIPQVFEGVHAWYDGLERTQLEAGYFTRVRTTSGVTNDLRLGILRAAWNPRPDHVLSAYGVFHDQPQNGAFTGFADNSYRVVGARAEGTFSRPAWGLGIPYLAEIAHQDAYAGGDPRIDARYWRLGAGLASASWTVRYDEELRGSNGGQYGLQAPLTDFYGFNGWTLHFFNVPRQGLHDRWLTARLGVERVTLYGEAHRFRSDYGHEDLGRELDLGVTVDLWHDITARLQHARYDAQSGALGDTRKTWFTLSWTF